MHTVRQILHEKGNRVWTIAPDETVFEAVRRMAEHGIGALVVVERGELSGIVSERDYARKIILKGRASPSTHVFEIMSSPVVTADMDWEVERCMREMTERRIRHLPVVEHGRLAGMVSIGDVVKAIISDQRFMIAQLEQYIQAKVE